MQNVDLHFSPELFHDSGVEVLNRIIESDLSFSLPFLHPSVLESTNRTPAPSRLRRSMPSSGSTSTLQRSRGREVGTVAFIDVYEHIMNPFGCERSVWDVGKRLHEHSVGWEGKQSWGLSPMFPVTPGSLWCLMELICGGSGGDDAWTENNRKLGISPWDCVKECHVFHSLEKIEPNPALGLFDIASFWSGSSRTSL